MGCASSKPKTKDAAGKAGAAAGAGAQEEQNPLRALFEAVGEALAKGECPRAPRAARRGREPHGGTASPGSGRAPAGARAPRGARDGFGLEPPGARQPCGRPAWATPATRPAAPTRPRPAPRAAGRGRPRPRTPLRPPPPYPSPSSHPAALNPRPPDTHPAAPRRRPAAGVGKDGQAEAAASRAADKAEAAGHTLSEIAGIITTLTKDSLGDLLLHPGHATVGVYYLARRHQVTPAGRAASLAVGH